MKRPLHGIPITFVSLSSFGCGGGAAPPSITSGGPILVSILPTSASLQVSGTQQFAATVTNDAKNGGVTWSLNVVRIPAMGSLTCNHGIDCGQISPASTGSSALATGWASFTADTPNFQAKVYHQPACNEIQDSLSFSLPIIYTSRRKSHTEENQCIVLLNPFRQTPPRRWLEVRTTV